MLEIIQAPDMVPLDQIDPNPYQPRHKDDDQVVLELADDIVRNGLMQIPTARHAAGGRYQLAFGHTRLAAFRHLLAIGKTEYVVFPLFIRELDDLQMFERAVAENIKRRDLSPIEVARAMQRYRDFGKNSAEIGSFFGVNEATVRGTIRLLELPEKAQEMVSDGSLTQGNARKLLSLGRIVNQDKVMEIAQKLPEAPDPDGLIGETLRNSSDNVVELGNQRYQLNNQVTAGDGLWELNWKVAEDDIHISKRWPLEKDLLASWKGEDQIDGMNVKNIFYAIFSALTSINPAAKKTYEDLYETHPEWSPAVDLYRHLMHPPLCSSCPLMVRTPAGYYFCGLKLCHSRKKAAWISSELHRLSKELGIQIYDAREDGQATDDLSEWNQEDKDLFEARDASLRLKAAPRSWGYTMIKNMTVKVVKVGEAVRIAKKEAAEERKNNAYDPGAWQRRQEIVKANTHKLNVFVWDQVTPMLEPLFAGITSLDVLEWMAAHASYRTWCSGEEPDEKEPKGIRMAFYRKRLAFAFILNNLDEDDLTEGDIIAETAGKICNKAKTAGIVFPKGWEQKWVTSEATQELVEVTA